MKTVKKIKVTGYITEITIPEYAPILNAGVEDDEIYVYILWEDNMYEEQNIDIFCYETEAPLNYDFGKYINTVSTSKGTFHLFEIREIPEFD